MEIVVDANIIMAVVLNEPDNLQVIEATKGIEFVSFYLMKSVTHFLPH